ncbi:MAG: hypothetical protein K2X47_04200 [Bdellovibrionales bacterium]|nr:hypothetical protein [Bdellovibrionales bacterium]
MKKNIWLLFFGLWFVLLMGGIAKGAERGEVPMTLTESSNPVEVSGQISCLEFHYFRESCGALVNLLTQDSLARSQQTLGHTTSLK